VSKEHSRIIIILLAGIFAVLLFGREVVQGSLQTAGIVGLTVGAIILVVTGIFMFVRYLSQEVKVYREDMQRERAAGKPWLYMLIAWPGIIGNFLVFGIAAYWWFIENSCRALMGDCLQSVPLWWVPVCFILISIPTLWIERAVSHFAQRRRRDT